MAGDARWSAGGTSLCSCLSSRAANRPNCRPAPVTSLLSLSLSVLPLSLLPTGSGAAHRDKESKPACPEPDQSSEKPRAGQKNERRRTRPAWRLAVKSDMLAVVLCNGACLISPRPRSMPIAASGPILARKVVRMTSQTLASVDRGGGIARMQLTSVRAVLTTMTPWIPSPVPLSSATGLLFLCAPRHTAPSGIPLLFGCVW